MAGNHLEELVAEWYQLRGYFVRQNVQVGKRSRGGWECELDIVAIHPIEKRVVHVEPSLDASSWQEREQRYHKKFEAGRKYIPEIFSGVDLPATIEQIALFVFGGGERSTLAGGRVLFIKDFMKVILDGIRTRRVDSAAIPEQYPLLRSLSVCSPVLAY